VATRSPPPDAAPEPPLDCGRCDRLVAFRETNRAAFPEWHNAPVRSFGPASARLLIVGLAPGLRGANRTGRPFTGDYAGDLLYETLSDFGFARGAYDARPDDGLELVGCMITNAVRCVPPENKPVGAETSACRPFLAARIKAMPKLAAIVALGKLAHDNTLRALGERVSAVPFGHGAQAEVQGPRGPLRLFDSYHCSRYNTNTGRLTADMFKAVFSAVQGYLAA